MHMDVETLDVEAVASELEANGAKRVSSHEGTRQQLDRAERFRRQ
jgi:hypothetical protein